MALIAIASDKGAPGVTTAALALAAVWPRPVLLAECDPAGGDLVYRFPAAGGGHLDPRRGVLSLAVVARRGMQSQQVWEHAQKLHGGLDVLAGVTNAEQGAGLSLLWGPIGKVLASLPQADVIADCGRLGADGPLYDLLAEATEVVLVTKVQVADVIRLRDRAAAFAAAAQSRGRRGFGVRVVVIADHRKLRAAIGEVQHVLSQASTPATVVGGIAHDSKGADLLSGEWGGNLDRTLLIKTAREVAQHLLAGLPPIASPPIASPAATSPPTFSPAVTSPAMTGSPAAAAATAAVISPAGTGAPASAGPAVYGSPGEDPQSAPFAVESGGRTRAVFGRVRGGRTGKHQAGPAQARYVSPPVASETITEPGQPRARHAQPYGRPAQAAPAAQIAQAAPTAQVAPTAQAPTAQVAPTAQAAPGPGSGPAAENLRSGSGGGSAAGYARTPMPPLTSPGFAPEPGLPPEPAEPLDQPGGEQAWTTPW